MLVQALHVILIISTLLVVGVAGACYWRYRRHMKASDQALHRALEEMGKEQEPKVGQQ